MSVKPSVPNPKTEPKHILIVDDDDVFRAVLVETLIKAGYRVTQAGLGKVAKDVIALQALDAVISDVNMPGISGIELLHYSRKLKPELPIILMTGFAELTETHEAHELGARGFLPKPFKKEELLELLKRCLFAETTPPVPEDDQDLNFCKLSIEGFISGHEMNSDIYVRLSGKICQNCASRGGCSGRANQRVQGEKY